MNYKITNSKLRLQIPFSCSYFKYWLDKSRNTVTLLIIITTFLTGCNGVRLIGAYDQVTDQGIQKVQGEISEVIVTLDKNLKGGNIDATAYDKFEKSYNTIEGEIMSLHIRSTALPKYNIITGQITELRGNTERLEKIHKLGLKISDTTTLRIINKTFEVQFTSMIALQNGLKRQKTN
jgi:predicted small secreted protein